MSRDYTEADLEDLAYAHNDESVVPRIERARGMTVVNDTSVLIHPRIDRFSLYPELDALRATSFWISGPLYRRVLDAVDEHPE